MKTILSIHEKINVRSHYVGLNTNLARVCYIVVRSYYFNSTPYFFNLKN